MTSLPRRLVVAACIVAIPLVAYPLVSTVGGAPRFPSRSDCIHPAVEGRPVDVVFGRLDTPDGAASLRDRVVKYGFVGTQVVGDDCGRWRVVLGNVPSVDVGEKVISEARRVGLSPHLELASG